MGPRYADQIPQLRPEGDGMARVVVAPDELAPQPMLLRGFDPGERERGELTERCAQNLSRFAPCGTGNFGARAGGLGGAAHGKLQRPGVGEPFEKCPALS